MFPQIFSCGTLVLSDVMQKKKHVCLSNSTFMDPTLENSSLEDSMYYCYLKDRKMSNVNKILNLLNKEISKCIHLT